MIRRHDARATSRRSAVAQVRSFVGDQPAFVEGLLLGAMVGAAIAGSTVWAQLRDRRRGIERGQRSESEAAEPQ